MIFWSCHSTQENENIKTDSIESITKDYVLEDDTLQSTALGIVGNGSLINGVIYAFAGVRDGLKQE